MQITENYLSLPSNTLQVEDYLYQHHYSPESIESTISATGITSFHVCDSGFTHFCIQTFQCLINDHNVNFSSVGSIIVVSQSFDDRIPSISTRLQKLLELPSSTFCIDVIDGCSGFIKALNLAKSLLESSCEEVLIVSGDLNSQLTINSHPSTRVLFGDGISVTKIQRSPSLFQPQILLFNDGDNSDKITCSFSENTLRMNGFEVFRFARTEVPKLIKIYLRNNSLQYNYFDVIILHQASKLVVDAIVKKMDRSCNPSLYFNCSTIGNIGAGSIGSWVALSSDFPLHTILKALVVGFGSGLSWGLAEVNFNLNTNTTIYV